MIEQYQPLFLKYRPQSLSDLVGQSYVALTLSNAIKHDRLAHAYLFTGPRGTGKTSSARILAKSLNCEKGPTAEPCQVCTSCVEIKQGISTSVLEIDAASNNSVDDARILIERAPLVAPGGRFKLYIIDECHMLTKEAFNALLKTIEEPPPNVIFILATTEEHKVPQTILSRCQRLMFRLIKQAELTEYLAKIAKAESISIDSQALELVARRSGGGLRDALGLLDQASLLSTPEKPVNLDELLLLVGALTEDLLLTMSKSILEKDGYTTLTLANQLLAEGKESYLIAAELAKHFLNLAKASCFTVENKNELSAFVLGSPKYIEGLLAYSAKFDRTELAQMVEALDRLEQLCKRSSQPALNLEIGLLSLCHRLGIADLKTIESRLTQLETQSENDLHIPAPINRKPDHAPAKSETPSEVEKPAEKILDKKEQPSINPTPAPAQSIKQPLESSQAEVDLDALWTDLLDELQKRHLPTYSLVSTHSFPLSLIGDEFILGVFVENFQKMIENKLEHVKAAMLSISGKEFKIKVKISASEAKPSQSKTSAKSIKPEVEGTRINSFASVPNKQENSTETKQITNEAEHHLSQEAYKLFEGPGSRQISVSQQ